MTLNPLDENYQTLLVATLTASGDRAAALDQVARCVALSRRSSAPARRPPCAPPLTAAWSAPCGQPRRPGRRAAQLEAGQAAVNAGAIDAGLECLRRAVAEADACGDTACGCRP